MKQTERMTLFMYLKRRKALAASLPDNCIALVFSDIAPYKVGDEKYDFSVDRNFYYLTGLDKENMILAIVKVNGKQQDYLFIDRYDEELAKWVGGRISPQAAAKTSQCRAIYWQDEVWEVLGSYFSRSFTFLDQVLVFADLNRQEVAQQDRASHRFTKQLQAYYPQASLRDLYPYMASLRLVKDEDELSKLQTALSITKEAIENMMTHAQANMYEYELEAYFDFVLKSNNCHHSFPSIIAGGKNATILHYQENENKIKDRSLVLCDLGAAYKYMNADITRTFPINGVFTKRQRQIYDIVLRANKYIISLVKPGVTLRELNNKVMAFYQQELSTIGLLKHGYSVNDYYWHGVSHMLGLETHDICLPDYPVQEGNVFTVEPGLYLEEEGIGIRIEDNVLVTKDGCDVLSKDIIKEIDEIEAFMAKK